MSQKTITKTARIERTPGESILIDETRVRLVKVKGKTWFVVEYPEGVQVSREEEQKTSDSTCQSAGE